MTGSPELILVYEPEEACRARLHKQGLAPAHVLEIASYLAQSTDLAPAFPAIADACARRGIAFRPCPLDDVHACLGGADPRRSLVWTLTDGIAYFRGGAAPALARLRGLRTFGADDSLFALCQDKFRSGAVLAALGLPVPPAGLARDGQWLVPPPECGLGYFVKPNRLGAKIGIWNDSHCRTRVEAEALSRRIFAAYRDDALVQAYVEGRNARASYLAVDPRAASDRLGVAFVESGGDFQTMEDSMALYGDTGAAALSEGRRTEPCLVAVAAERPEADAAARRIADRLLKGLGLRDVFSFDLRIAEDGSVQLLEFEVCPGLPCFDFRAYCRSEWGMGLEEAMAATAAARLLSPP